MHDQHCGRTLRCPTGRLNYEPPRIICLTTSGRLDDTISAPKQRGAGLAARNAQADEAAQDAVFLRR